MLIQCRYDVDFPLEVDDVSWDLTNEAEHYPLKHNARAGGTNVLSYLVSKTKLHLIHGFIMRTLVSELTCDTIT